MSWGTRYGIYIKKGGDDESVMGCVLISSFLLKKYEKRLFLSYKVIGVQKSECLENY